MFHSFSLTFYSYFLKSNINNALLRKKYALESLLEAGKKLHQNYLVRSD